VYPRFLIAGYSIILKFTTILLGYYNKLRIIMSIQVYGIPNCGTCKKAFNWLQNNHIDYEFINTKETPPTREAINNWVESLGSAPMRNTSGQSYRALGDEKKNWTDEQWIEAFAKDAMLLKRPLFVKDGKAVAVGFRDEKVIQEKLSIKG
jgi:arsenate reductase (glutaredoxin)